MSDWPELAGGEQVTVRWPGGTHDFVIKYTGAELVAGPSWSEEPWFVVHGDIIEPARSTLYGFYSRRTGPAEFTMLPHRA